MALVTPERRELPAAAPESPLSEAAAGTYRLIAETIPHMVWTAGADGRLDFFNRRCSEYTGSDISSLSGWGWKSVVHPDDWDRCLASWTRALQTGERYEIEYRLRRADGVYRWHHGSAVPISDALGRPQRWFGTCTDIESEVRSAQILEEMVKERTKDLQEAQGRLHEVLDNAPECVKLLDHESCLLEMNASGLRMIEADSLEPLLGKSVLALLLPEHREAFRDLTRRVCAGERGTLEFEVLGLRGTHRWLETHAVPFFEQRTGSMRLLGITRDITDRKLAEQARIEAEKQARGYAGDIRRLMHRLVSTQESERRRLADDLHDLIGQNLTALGIELTSLQQRLAREDAQPAASARLDAMKTLVEQTIDAIRGVMTDLRPPALEEYGLEAALRAHMKEFAERTGMKTSVSGSGRGARLPREAELALFRIAQEALTNAAKHSGGTRVHASITHEERRVRLVLEDDGRGFADPIGARSARRGGWGLPAMRERAEAHGGMVRIEFPGTGTRLIVEIPDAPANPGGAPGLA